MCIQMCGFWVLIRYPRNGLQPLPLVPPRLLEGNDAAASQTRRERITGTPETWDYQRRLDPTWRMLCETSSTWNMVRLKGLVCEVVLR